MAFQGWLQHDGNERRGPGAARRRVLLGMTAARPGGGAVALTVHNISRTGMLLECTEPLAIEETLAVELPGDERAKATVRWTSERLAGCEFTAPLNAATLSAALLRSDIVEPPAAQHKRAGADDDDASAALGDRLHTLRKARGLTLADVATALGVSKPTVWAWEHGRTAPSAERYARIAAVLGTSEAEIRSGIDVDAARSVVSQSRRRIAEAYQVEVSSVKIMIEL